MFKHIAAMPPGSARAAVGARGAAVAGVKHVEHAMARKLTTTRRIAPEDLRSGMFVVITSRIHEMIPFCSFDPAVSRRLEPIRYSCNDCADGTPLRVLVVCLPFVHVDAPDGSLRALDTRMTILARVSEDYALEAFTRPGKPKPDCGE